MRSGVVLVGVDGPHRAGQQRAHARILWERGPGNIHPIELASVCREDIRVCQMSMPEWAITLACRLHCALAVRARILYRDLSRPADACTWPAYCKASLMSTLSVLQTHIDHMAARHVAFRHPK